MLDAELIRKHYATLSGRVTRVRSLLKRPLTMAEKILYAHLDKIEGPPPVRGKSFLMLRPDRVAMQDATAQMAILQFIASGSPRVAVPVTVHCDHLIQGRAGAHSDLETALRGNREVYDFLASASRKYGMGFWKPGAGIIHQVVLENYAFPGGLMIGTDSHTPNAGGMGMIAVGVGGADAVDVMAGLPWELLCPKLVGVRLSGRLSGWASAKDVILKLCEILTCAGGTNKIIEYFGPGVASISLTGRGTITNMGAELGATTSLFPADRRTAEYLSQTRRERAAEWFLRYLPGINADEAVHAEPEKYYDELVEINLDELGPMLVGPHSPDVAHTAESIREDAAREGYPEQIRVCLIGSCTNSSYEDIGRAAHVARQAVAKGLQARTPLLVTPGSNQVYATLERDGLLGDLRALGATILANACGPCIGQWKREDLSPADLDGGAPNTIVTSFNRNFRGRNDGNKNTLAFIGSPELVVAKALSGRLSFNPLAETLTNARGEAVKLEAPEAPDLPEKGFVFDAEGFQPPGENDGRVTVSVAPDSERLQLLEPFPPWEGRDLRDLRVLLKARGKCTTDHISAAGRWLRFRGHLDRIADNLFLGAVNAFTGQAGTGVNLRNGERGQPFPKIARDYKRHGIAWVAVGDHNYGEGSSREHAALEPRHLGGRAVIARSFARIHETNLKKQGLLALTFADPADYEKVREDDRVAILGLPTFAPGKPLSVELTHADGRRETFPVRHSFNAEQIEWFKAGSALNRIKQTLAENATRQETAPRTARTPSAAKRKTAQARVKKETAARKSKKKKSRTKAKRATPAQPKAPTRKGRAAKKKSKQNVRRKPKKKAVEKIEKTAARKSKPKAGAKNAKKKSGQRGAGKKTAKKKAGRKKATQKKRSPRAKKKTIRKRTARKKSAKKRASQPRKKARRR